MIADGIEVPVGAERGRRFDDVPRLSSEPPQMALRHLLFDFMELADLYQRVLFDLGLPQWTPPILAASEEPAPGPFTARQ